MEPIPRLSRRARTRSLGGPADAKNTVKNDASSSGGAVAEGRCCVPLLLLLSLRAAVMVDGPTKNGASLFDGDEGCYAPPSWYGLRFGESELSRKDLARCGFEVRPAWKGWKYCVARFGATCGTSRHEGFVARRGTSCSTRRGTSCHVAARRGTAWHAESQIKITARRASSPKITKRGLSDSTTRRLESSL